MPVPRVMWSRIAVSRHGRPKGPGALLVELDGDLAGAPASGIRLEDSPHDGGLGLVDAPRAGLAGH
jgi:hypothetical protein